jgi:hypothetical protein
LSRQCVQAADFAADRTGRALNERFVESRGKTDWFGKIGRWQCADRPVQRFRPPVVGGHLQTRNGGRRIEQLIQLFLCGQLLDQLCSQLFRRRRFCSRSRIGVCRVCRRSKRHGKRDHARTDELLPATWNLLGNWLQSANRVP